MRTFVRKLAHALARDAIDDVGAMMAFYAILAVFPMVFFVVTLVALVLPAHTIAGAAGAALDAAPITTRDLFASQIAAVTSHARPGFAFGTVLFAVWGASRGASGLMLALNKLFGRVETRSWLRRQAIAIALTLAVAVLMVIAFALLVAGPVIGGVVEDRLGLGSAFEIGWMVGRWILAGLLVMVVWALAYRLLPDTDAPFRIFTPGAVASVGLWLAISRLFALYFDHVGSFTLVYGTLGSAVIVLTWLWLSGMSLLLGAEINEVLAGDGKVHQHDPYAGLVVGRLQPPIGGKDPIAMLNEHPGHLALLFQERVERYGDKTALRYRAGDRWHDISWKTFGETIHAVAKGLIELGVKEGERVGIYSANRPEWTIADLAAMRIRAATVPIYPSSTAQQAAYIIDDAEIRVLFVGGRDQYDRARSLLAEHPHLELVVIDPAVEHDPSDGSLAFSELVAVGREAEHDADVAARLARARSDDLATLIYTSGTTGAPKGVMLDHANLVGLLAPHDLRLRDLDLGEADRSLCFLPLSHVYERCWTFYALSRGMTNHYVDDPGKVLEAAREIQPTVMCAVPRLYEKIYTAVTRKTEAASRVRQRLFHWAIAVGADEARHRREARPIPLLLRLEHRIADALVLHKIRALVGGHTKLLPCAGAPLAREIEDFFTAAGLFICQGYGLTETSATVTSCELHYTPGTVGKPLPGTEVKIGDNGEILVKGPGVMRGYYKRPEDTAAAFVDGWFRTGDAGVIDETGSLIITDRIKDLMKTSGGKYVAPQQLESELASDAFIEQAAVIGDQRKFVSALIVPSFVALEDWARERGIAFTSRQDLIERPEVTSLYQERIDALNARLARFEQIKKFVLLPKEFSVDGGEITPTMKTRRKQVQARYSGKIEAMYRDAA